MDQAARAPEPLVGGRYRIHRLLGEGGMGVVYEVRDEATGQRLALKRVHSHITNRALFEREYRTLASLHHSGIVKVFDYGVEEAGAFYTMELLEGTDLSKAAPMPWREVCGCLRECASILGVLHAHRLVHRDLNPRNIWRQPDGKLKLLDFGALAPFGKARDVVGVPALVAPEALRSGVLDQRTDLFALGALGYWLLTSTHAYQAAQFAELKRVWERVPASPSSVAQLLARADVDIPDQLDKLLLSLLRLDPAERPSSTFNVIDELNAMAGLAPEVEEVAATGYLESTEFVGRERERDVFSACVTRALAGGLQVISLEGPEGIGRTRLLGELAIAARLAGATVLSAAAGAGDRPYHTLSSLGCALQMALPHPASQAARPHAQILGTLSPELNQLLGQPEAPLRAADPAEERQRKQEAFAEWLLGVAHEHPLVVLVDDLHVADEESQALLATLARSRPQHRLLLVGTLRTDSPLAEHAAVRAFQAVARRLVIPPFEGGQALELLRSIFGPVAYLERLALRLHEVSAGVPRHLLLLARHLVRTGAAKYVDGIWILPSEVPQDLPATLDTSVRASLDAVDPDARALARLASVPDHGSLSRTMLAALYGKSPAQTDEAIATLLEAQVLSESRDGLQPTQARLAALLWAELNADEQFRAHRTVAACLDAQDDPVLGMRKALHLLRGGAFEAAESLVLTAARQVLLNQTEVLRTAAPMFAEACELLEAGGRSEYARLPALMVLALCGYFVDRSYAARYSDQATTQLGWALRFGLARRLTPILGGLLSLLVALLVASVTLRLRRSKMSVLEVVSWLVASAVASAGTAATCLDPRAIRRHANSIAPLRGLGKNHAASIAHDFCTALALGSEDRQAASLALSQRVLDRLTATAAIPGLHHAARAKFLIGAHFQIGVRLALACDLRALALADTLAQMGPLPSLQADQIRALCLSSRGDHVGAAVYERQIEPKAIKLGTAWQAEIWLPIQALRRALLTNDAVGAKHASQALRRLVAEAQTPTLAAHESSAQATYLVLRHKYREAISVLDADEEPLARAGWAYSRGLLARAHNEQAEYAEAERLCGDALSRLDRADLDFVTLNLCLQSESAIAQAGQGRFEEADRSLAGLLTAYADKGSLVLGWLHRARARVASMKGDADAAERELALMEQQYLTTRNPHLLRLTAELKVELRSASSGSPARDLTVTAEHSHLLTRVRLLLDDEAKDRVQRGKDALTMAKQLVGAVHGFISYAGALIAWTGQRPSPDAIAWADERLQVAAAEGGRTASTSLTEFATEDERGVFDGMHHSLCLLWHLEGYLEVPIAALVLASEASPPDVPPGAVLHVMGASLAAAASVDASTVRSRRPDGASCDSQSDHATQS